MPYISDSPLNYREHALIHHSIIYCSGQLRVLQCFAVDKSGFAGSCFWCNLAAPRPDVLLDIQPPRDVINTMIQQAFRTVVLFSHHAAMSSVGQFVISRIASRRVNRACTTGILNLTEHTVLLFTAALFGG